LRYSKILDETIKNIVPSSRERMVEKEKELNSLLKTPKGLGKLEELAIQIEGIKKDYRPEKKIVIVMAADNGVEREKVSKSKRIITQYVVEAMLQGKSSINALGKTFGADIEVVDLGIDEAADPEEKINLAGIINRKLMQTGTHNIAEGPAMDYITAVKAIETGIEIADISQLSSGELCLVSLIMNACVLTLTGYKVFCLDEIDANLDIINRKKFNQIIDSLLATLEIDQIICISHSVESASDTAYRIIIGDIEGISLNNARIEYKI